MAYDIGYHCKPSIGYVSEHITGDVDPLTKIGSRLCKRHQSSLQQFPYSVWLAASTMTSSVASLARAQALRLPNCLAQTAQVQWSWAPLQAFCATMQASAPAVKLKIRAFAGASTFQNRWRGHTLPAVFSI
jgi:hypothetical protein